MPSIIAANLFDSRLHFSNIHESPLRTVKHYEIELYVNDGGFIYLNGQYYPRKSNIIFISKPGDKRKSTLPFSCHYIYIQEASGIVKQMLDNAPNFSYVENSQEYEEIFKRIAGYFLSGQPYDELALTGETLTLLYRIYENHLENAKKSLDPSSKAKGLFLAKKYINEHYAEEITIEELAQISNLSIPYFHKVFFKTFGISPHMAVLNRRIEAAKIMISCEDASISDIAIRCGFNSQAHFSYCFKQKTGMSPSKFKQTITFLH